MRKKEGTSRTLTIDILIALLCGLIGTTTLILLAAVMVSGGTLAETSMPFAASLAAFPGALLSSVLVVRRVGTRTLLIGLAMGVGFFLVLLLLGAVLYLRWMPQTGAVPMLLSTVMGGCLGGLLGGMKKRRRDT